MKKHLGLMVSMMVICIVSFYIGANTLAAPDTNDDSAVLDSVIKETTSTTIDDDKDQDDATDDTSVRKTGASHEGDVSASNTDSTDEANETSESGKTNKDGDPSDTEVVSRPTESTGDNGGTVTNSERNNTDKPADSDDVANIAASSQDVGNDTKVKQPEAYTKGDGSAIMVNEDGTEQLLGVWIGERFFAAKNDASTAPVISQELGECEESIYNLGGVTFIQEHGAPSMEPLMRYYSTLWICGAATQCFSSEWTYRSMLSSDGVPGIIVDFENKELKFIEVDLGDFVAESGYETLQVTI